MSFAVTGLRAPGVTILDPGCVTKTFPAYFERLEELVEGFSKLSRQDILENCASTCIKFKDDRARHCHTR